MYYVPIQPKEFVLQFASFLLKSNSLRFGVFTLASGKQSAYYIDLRVLVSFGISAGDKCIKRHGGRKDRRV